MIENECNNTLLDENRKSGAIRLQIVPAQPKTLTHLPQRPPVDLAFQDLVYSVREGRRNRKYHLLLLLAISCVSFSLIVSLEFIEQLKLSHTQFFDHDNNENERSSLFCGRSFAHSA